MAKINWKWLTVGAVGLASSGCVLYISLQESPFMNKAVNQWGREKVKKMMEDLKGFLSFKKDS